MKKINAVFLLEIFFTFFDTPITVLIFHDEP